MSWFEALILGIVQGLSEFLPISSSGHLVLVGLLMGAKASVAFDVALHAGTLVAVVAFYRRDLLVMLKDAVRSVRALAQRTEARTIWEEHHGTRLALLVGLATVPTAVIALALKGPVEHAFGSGAFTAGAMVVTGLLLLTTRWAPVREPGEPGAPTAVTVKVALLIGVAQGIAVLPGISRSGSTLVAALLLGVGRSDGARFAFLLSIPAILGAVILEGRHAASLGTGALPLALGVVAAMVVGYASLGLLTRIIRVGRLDRFAWYLIPVGVAGTIYFLTR